MWRESNYLSVRFVQSLRVTSSSPSVRAFLVDSFSRRCSTLNVVGFGLGASSVIKISLSIVFRRQKIWLPKLRENRTPCFVSTASHKHTLLRFCPYYWFPVHLQANSKLLVLTCKVLDSLGLGQLIPFVRWHTCRCHQEITFDKRARFEEWSC